MGFGNGKNVIHFQDQSVTRYRHLLHSLSHVHHYLCHTPEDRSSKFLPFLKLIDCAEKTREKKTSCHRPNITLNVWNQILRVEVGPEICE
ncbi:hypothetical protein E2C01_025631 [Portunus trituberculatus]|uniref:Uncharacterized protein n=1 Tax=Portunus trituberculatus TaxID=210409 RepID=A0A5B7EDT4_PORTR|nr:hypothetical protein [Portunus trituberculatus]